MACLLFIPQFARSAGVPRPVPLVQADYLAALSAADHFLQAWQSGDAENGTSLLTSHAKTVASAEIVEKFFSSAAPSAYEIESGKMLRRGHYQFPVVLMTAMHKRVHRQFSSIIVLNTAGNDWAIDKLP